MRQIRDQLEVKHVVFAQQAAVFVALTAGKKACAAPPVCAWDTPGGNILEKKLNHMGYEETSLDVKDNRVAVVAALIVAGLAVAAYKYRDLATGG